ncbi:MAG: hypothetical protein K9G39_06475 [Chlorobium sp.]|uniref:hypothetical protein n=1 Tax=Chlorobium sp. TaxID=1095 RepID=UPI0025B9E606|nr:hypothetical protein [Chlorobium sp.]MCF8383228.1 hypothetical protein [Chlorobium sp.]
MDVRMIRLFLFAVILGVVTGCGKENTESAKSGKPGTPVLVESIVAVGGLSGGGEEEVLAVPEGAVFHQGVLSGVYVVDDEGRLTVRWVRTGRAVDGSLVILGGLDAGERVLGRYNRSLREGVTVKQQVSETKEIQSNE